MSSETMHKIVELLESAAHEQPSPMEFEMAYQARIASDRIRFAIRHADQLAKTCEQMRDDCLQSLEALERMEIPGPPLGAVESRRVALQQYPTRYRMSELIGTPAPGCSGVAQPALQRTDGANDRPYLMKVKEAVEDLGLPRITSPRLGRRYLARKATLTEWLQRREARLAAR